MNRLNFLYLRLVSSGPEGFMEILLFALLIPLGWIYGLLGALRVKFYRFGILPTYRAKVPVISVGNIAVGGTGKTPTVDFIVKYYISAGEKVAVVSRGYGGEPVRDVEVVCNGTGPLLPPEVCGDEPYLLARRNPKALVFVAPRRSKGIEIAVEQFGAEIIILDDGFQHLAVRRNLDIVLLDASRPLGNGHVLPAGLLREFPGALSRGDVFLLTRCSEAGEKRISLPGPVLCSQHVLSEKVVCVDGAEQSLNSLQGKKGVAFCGIANPAVFFEDLEKQGLTLHNTLSFADHVHYGAAEIERIVEASNGADYLVTTEKDGVKLLGKSFPVPCFQVPLALRFFEQGQMENVLNSVLCQGG